MAKSPTLSRTSQAPGGALRSISPHASNTLPDGVCRGVFVGGAGDIALVAVEDTAAVVLKNVAAGTLLPIAVKAVRIAGTSATDLVAVY